MSEEGHDLVVKIHRQELERYQAQKQKERALVEAMFREALERKRQQEQEELALVKAVHAMALEELRGQPGKVVELPTIHYTELAEAEPGSPLCREWNTYRREVGRMLAEGKEGKFALIKEDSVIGIYDTLDAARHEGLKRYLQEPFLVQPIRTREPHLRIRGVNFPWPRLRLV